MFSRDSLHLWILGAGLAAVVGGFLAVRAASLPPTWGQYGHWRGAALQEQADKPRNVTARADCLGCHQTPKHAFGKKHQTVLCSECHGQGRNHIQDCKAKQAALPQGATLTCEHDHIKPERLVHICAHCHAQVVGRPASHPQIDIAEHLKEQEAKDPKSQMACLQCHQAHDPSEEPEEAESDDAEEKDDDGAGAEKPAVVPGAATPAEAATPTAAPTATEGEES